MSEGSGCQWLKEVHIELPSSIRLDDRHARAVLGLDSFSGDSLAARFRLHICPLCQRGVAPGSV